jgi:hypothetical protein
LCVIILVVGDVADPRWGAERASSPAIIKKLLGEIAMMPLLVGGRLG